jgi:argininosuccinate lyase
MYYYQDIRIYKCDAVLFGLWFSAYAETLIDDITMLNAALKVVDQNPLGRLPGTEVRSLIDRTFTTKSWVLKPSTTPVVENQKNSSHAMSSGCYF